jgi:hypothetical protein
MIPMKYVSAMILALVVMISASSASAASIGFAGFPSAVEVSDTFTVDIVADLTGGFDISGFAFSVLYDPSLMMVTGESYNFAPDVLDLEGTFASISGIGDLAPGVYNVGSGADFSVSDFSAQSDIITLVTLTFKGLGFAGTSALDIDFDPNFFEGLIDPAGELLDTTVVPSSITLAPAPMGLLLVVSGIVALVGIRRTA